MREEVGYGDAPTFENKNYCPGEKLHYSPHGDLGEKLGLRVTNVVFLEIKLKSNAACKTRIPSDGDPRDHRKKAEQVLSPDNQRTSQMDIRQIEGGILKSIVLFFKRQIDSRECSLGSRSRECLFIIKLKSEFNFHLSLIS